MINYIFTLKRHMYVRTQPMIQQTDIPSTISPSSPILEVAFSVFSYQKNFALSALQQVSLAS